ncbi:MAG TPA: hypothetical protein VGN86_14645 [Pyrinomonadaceae bacterium]|jgi:hypothetical protein|nr:hypothetical protein [Pyrinomonadaceae bacterium]
MTKQKPNIIGYNSPSVGETTPSFSITATPSPLSDVTKTYCVVNQMVTDGVIKNYALGGAMGAFFYIEPSFTSDMDIFCLLAHDPDPSGLVMLTPIMEYLKKKGFEPTGLGAMIEGVDVQFQFPDDPLGEASIETAISHDLGGIPVRVMTPEYLIVHMLRTNRPKDRLRLVRFIETQVFNPSTVYGILSANGLEDRYDILERLENEVSE